MAIGIGTIFFAAMVFSLQAGIAFALGNADAGSGLMILAFLFFVIGAMLLAEKR